MEQRGNKEQEVLSPSPSSLTSLDPSERDVQREVVNDAATQHHHVAADVSFRHSHCRRDRQKIRSAIEWVEGNPKRLDRWDRCGQGAMILQDAKNEKHYSLRSMICRDRFCPTCSSERARSIARNLLKKIEDRPHRFITLTVRHGEERLEDLINKLMRSFKELRRTKLWKKKVDGGAAFLEIKRGNGWHPHLHLVCVGDYIDHAELRREWLRITKDSSIVDIRLIREPRKTASYVAKYASKPLSPSVINDPAALREAIRTLPGRKLLWTFGEWRGWRVHEDSDPTVWMTVGTLNDVLELAKAGDKNAREIIDLLEKGRPWRRTQDTVEEKPPDG